MMPNWPWKRASSNDVEIQSPSEAEALSLFLDNAETPEDWGSVAADQRSEALSEHMLLVVQSSARMKHDGGDIIMAGMLERLAYFLTVARLQGIDGAVAALHHRDDDIAVIVDEFMSASDEHARSFLEMHQELLLTDECIAHTMLVVKIIAERGGIDYITAQRESANHPKVRLLKEAQAYGVDYAAHRFDRERR
jgi:hypothetical protein